MFVELIHKRWNAEQKAQEEAHRMADLKARGVTVKRSYADNKYSGQKRQQAVKKKKGKGVKGSRQDGN